MKKISIIFVILVIFFSSLVFFNKKAEAGLFDFLLGKQKELKVVGNRLYWNNLLVNMRGVAVGDPHSRETNDNRTVDDYQVISKEWQANVVRLSVHPGVWRRDEERGKEFLEQEIKAARDNDLFVIVDWHVIGEPNGWYKPSSFGEDHYYSYNSNFNTARSFWKYMAVQYRNDNGVLFELWNEPASGGEGRPDITWQKLKPYMSQLYDTIRGNGANNVIIVPGVWWTYDMRGIKNGPLDGKNIAYAWHNYPANNRYLSWDKALDGMDKKYPIFVTEWGMSSDPNDKFYYANEDNYGVPFSQLMVDKYMNFTAWAWHGSWKPKMLKADWLEPNDYGKFIQRLLWDIKMGRKKVTPSNQKFIINDKVEYFIKNGYDKDSKKIGMSERQAVVNTYFKAFKKMPSTQEEMADVNRIANGLLPISRSVAAEKEAGEKFKIIYKRRANLKNKKDNSAVMILAYGIRQKPSGRNLTKEGAGIGIFKKIYHCSPVSTDDWNIVQAIAYSGCGL